MDELRSLKQRHDTLIHNYRKLAWASLQAMNTFELYLKDKKTGKEAGRDFQRLFDDIPDLLDSLEYGDFKETDSVSGDSSDSK